MDGNYAKKYQEPSSESVTIDESNNYGMQGMFFGIEASGNFYTAFITDNQSCMVRVCQHENMAQAQMMADEFNQFSSLM